MLKRKGGGGGGESYVCLYFIFIISFNKKLKKQNLPKNYT